jgi:glycosyltransferase involved in cell wall biosynthesis
MRIGIDARQLCGRTTGVGRYLLGLISEWKTNHDPRAAGHQFFLYMNEAADSTTGLDARRFITRVVPGSGRTWWEQVQLPRAAAADHLDVFFAPQYTAPLALRTPTVLTIHDVSFAAHPEWFRVREGARLRWLSRQSAAKARAVVTVSEFSRREIVEHFGIPDARLRVIPGGIPTRHVDVRGGGKPEPRLLFVGSIFNRRHVVDLIRAFAAVARQHPGASLDLAGDNRSYPREDVAEAIVREDVGDRIRWHRYVSDEQLRDLYLRARAFAFLSEYEGQGLTPLEALAAGAPSVLLDTQIAREICGASALYVDVGDLRAIADTIEQVLFDEPTRARLLAAAPEVLARYNWSRAGRDTLTVIEQSARASD